MANSPNPPVEEITPDGNPTGAVQAAPVKPTKPTTTTEKPIEEAPKGVIESLERVDEGAPTAPKTDDNIINLDAFLDAKESQEQQIARKDAAKAKEVLNPPTVAPVEKPAESNKRDYTDLSEEEKPLFERMSNDAFNKLKPVYLEHKKLKTEVAAKDTELTTTKKQLEDLQKGVVKIPDSYYSHPQAYSLTPEFEKAAAKTQEANIILNHWNKQLEAIEQGAKEIEVLDRHPQTGQLYIAKKMPANITTEAEIKNFIPSVQQNLIKSQADLEVVRQTYSSKYQEAVNAINQRRQAYFGNFYATEENKAVYEPLVKKAMENIPTVFHNTPAAQMLAESMVMNVQLANLVAQLQNGSVKPTNGKPVKPAPQGPTGAEIAGESELPVPKAKKGEDVTVDDFEKVKGGYN